MPTHNDNPMLTKAMYHRMLRGVRRQQSSPYRSLRFSVARTRNTYFSAIVSSLHSRCCAQTGHSSKAQQNSLKQFTSRGQSRLWIFDPRQLSIHWLQQRSIPCVADGLVTAVIEKQRDWPNPSKSLAVNGTYRRPGGFPLLVFGALLTQQRLGSIAGRLLHGSSSAYRGHCQSVFKVLVWGRDLNCKPYASALLHE